MRRLKVLEHLSLDGVIQSPGSAEEDPSGGFRQGGWIGPYADEGLGAALRAQMEGPFDLLLGRRTYDIWAPFWPLHAEDWPAAQRATKYVATRSGSAHRWEPCVFLDGDIPARVRALKEEEGPELHLWGSGALLQTLLAADLVDEFWLLLYPLTLGPGKRLFGAGTLPASFRLKETRVAANGLMLLDYERVRKD